MAWVTPGARHCDGMQETGAQFSELHGFFKLFKSDWHCSLRCDWGGGTLLKQPSPTGSSAAEVLNWAPPIMRVAYEVFDSVSNDRLRTAATPILCVGMFGSVLSGIALLASMPLV